MTVRKVIQKEEIKIWSYYQMANTETWICPENEIHKISRDFEIQTDPLVQVRRPHLMLINIRLLNKKSK